LVYCLGAYRANDRHATAVARALADFKYHGDRAAGRAIYWLATRYSASLDVNAPCVVVPVPLEARRLRSRGFNQAAWIARAIAQTRGLRLDASALARTGRSTAQATLTRPARRRQSVATFAARADRVGGADLLIVDDVTTTGTTLANCALALEQAGASSVQAVTLLGVERYDVGRSIS
jgi:ComF family protein